MTDTPVEIVPAQPQAVVTQKTSNLQEALRQAASVLAQQISDVTSVTVETRWVEVGDDDTIDFTKAHLAARTEIALDGDTNMVVPVRRENGLLVRDDGLLQVHLGNVEKAIEYRKELLATIIQTVQQLRGR